MLLAIAVMAAVFSFLLQSQKGNGMAFRVGQYLTQQTEDTLVAGQDSFAYDAFSSVGMPTLTYSNCLIETQTQILADSLVQQQMSAQQQTPTQQQMPAYQLKVISCVSEEGRLATITSTEGREYLYFEEPGAYCVTYLLTDGKGHKQHGIFQIPVQRKL